MYKAFYSRRSNIIFSPVSARICIGWLYRLGGHVKCLLIGLAAVSLLSFTAGANAAKPSWAGSGGGGGGGNNAGGSLTAPSSFSAIAVSTSQINLSWTDPNDGESGFEIQRSSDTSGFSTITTTDKNATSYSNTGLNSGTTYYYRIRSIGRKGSSSDYVSADATTETQSTDTQAPSVSINPVTDQTYTSAQSVTLSASAADNVGVTKVEFWDGSTLMKTDNSAPYDYAWNITDADNGTHTWTVFAYDAAYNTSQDSVNLTVDIASADTQAPSVSISPGTSQTYTSAQSVAISAFATDNVSVSKVEFWDGSTLRKLDGSAPYSFNWSVTDADNGTHTWKAIAFDTAGNTSQDSVNLTVNIASADTQAPSISISPGTSQTYTSAQSVAISAFATDNVSVSKVEFWDGSTLMKSDSGAPYDYAWGITDADNGTHTWTAIAYDAAGNTGQASVALSVDIGTDTTPGGDGAHQWSKKFGPISGDTGNVLAKGVATDPNGGILIAGHFTSTVDFGNQSFTASGGVNSFIARFLPDGSRLWSRQIGSSDIRINDISADSDGSMVVIGEFTGTANLGGVTLTSTGNKDIFLAKYSSDGDLLWATRSGGTSTDAGEAVAVDASGNILVTGTFSSLASFDGASLTSAGGKDIFLAKYSANGNLLWARRAGGSSSDYSLDLAVGPGGYVSVTGYFSGTATFGGTRLSSAGGYDIFAARYSAEGNLAWAKRFGASGYDYGYGIATDANGNLVLAGIFNGSINFGGGTVSASGSTDTDIYLAKLSPTGAHLWSQAYGTLETYPEIATAVAVDDTTGEIALTGKFFGQTNFDGNWLFGNGNYNTYVVKFNANGTHIWSTQAGAAGNDSGEAIAIDQDGNVIGTGNFADTVNFGGGDLHSSTSSFSYYDQYLVKFGP